jgi:hypothetical protein
MTAWEAFQGIIPCVSEKNHPRRILPVLYSKVWFNQPFGLAIKGRIHAPLYSGVELYPRTRFAGEAEH